MASPLVLPSQNHFWLRNAHAPSYLLGEGSDGDAALEGLGLYHLEIENGKFKQIITANKSIEVDVNIPSIDLARRIIFPCFVDIHTHLDKGHIWRRSPNANGTFAGAIESTERDAKLYGRQEDVYRRMEFGLKCSYAHGTAAVRTHIEAAGDRGIIGFEVFWQLCQEWADRLVLQGVAMVTTDYYLTAAGGKLADQMTEQGGILGGVAYENPDLTAQLTRLMALAQERGLDLDLHVDENGDRHSRVLHQVATIALKIGFTGQIVCGHCCSLGVQSQKQVQKTLTLVKKAGVAIVSLPLCNLYLQGRGKPKQPAWRGITRVHGIASEEIPLAFASDNCRDPFFPFGDHDGLEVLNQSVRIAQLDPPYGKWCSTVNQTPAQMMGLQEVGKLQPGFSADFVIFSARYFNELFSRPQGDRLIIRKGKAIEAVPPDYQELDDLVEIV